MNTCHYDDDRHRLCTEVHVCPVSAKVIELCTLCNSCECDCVCFEWTCVDCKDSETGKCFFCSNNAHYNNGMAEDKPEACVNYSFTRDGLSMQFLFQFGDNILSFETPNPIQLNTRGCSSLNLISTHRDQLMQTNQNIILESESESELSSSSDN